MAKEGTKDNRERTIDTPRYQREWPARDSGFSRHYSPCSFASQSDQQDKSIEWEGSAPGGTLEAVMLYHLRDHCNQSKAESPLTAILATWAYG